MSAPSPVNPIDPIALVIEARPRDLGGFGVRRALPWGARRMIGPFIFFDHIGPSEMAPGHGIDVRPHPHIALATVTYLFAGEMDHRDSLGSHQTIRPGDVNWMLAGRGIVHSERTGAEARRRGGPLHGIQSWVALPTADEENAPRFEHHPTATIPHLTRPGAALQIVAGTAYGARSPVGVCSPTLYVAATLEAGATLPLPDEHPERAIYVVEGEVSVGPRRLAPGAMALFHSGPAELRALAPSRFVLIGGAPVDGERHIWWNFVASSPDRIERAKSDWREGRFGVVPGDDREFIPLPEG
jgi:redox-sensitive bicupin YhaK (pirin superfamily)